MRWRALLHVIDAIILRRFGFVLDSGRLMGVSFQEHRQAAQGRLPGIGGFRSEWPLLSVLQPSRRVGPLCIVQLPLISADRSTVEDPLPTLRGAGSGH